MWSSGAWMSIHAENQPQKVALLELPPLTVVALTPGRRMSTQTHVRLKVHLFSRRRSTPACGAPIELWRLFCLNRAADCTTDPTDNSYGNAWNSDVAPVVWLLRSFMVYPRWDRTVLVGQRLHCYHSLFFVKAFIWSCLHTETKTFPVSSLRQSGWKMWGAECDPWPRWAP